MVPIGRSRVWRLAIVIVGLCIAAGALPAAADPQDRLDEIHDRQRRVQEHIDRLADQSDTLAGRIRVLDEKRSQVEGRVDSLDGRLERLNARITEVKEALSEAQQKMSILTRQLQSILADLDARTQVYEARARELYIAGPSAYVDGLLTADSFADLYDKFSYYSASVDADAELINDIQLLRDKTTTRREQVSAEEERIAKAKLQLEKDRQTIEAARAEQARLLAEREAVLGAKRQLLAQVETKKAAYEKVQDQLDEDAARIQSLLSSGSSSGAAPGGTGQLSWPASGPVTSGFGWRVHPIFGDRRLHTGIDIGAPYGAAVFAADDGTVVFAGVMSGYGNVVVIDHGGGLATAYAHLSAFQVSYGQSVDRGQQIANVGCTGYCTGPHLHFEVRVNGTPVDPMPYL